MKPASVYVMQALDGALKVGISCQPEERRKQITKRGPLTIVHATQPSERARLIEKTAHRLLELAGKLIDGPGTRREWFAASLDEAIAAIEQAERVADGLQPEPPARAAKVLLSVGLRLAPDDFRLVDEIRRLEPDCPTRSEMVRRLVIEGGKARGLVPDAPKTRTKAQGTQEPQALCRAPASA